MVRRQPPVHWDTRRWIAFQLFLLISVGAVMFGMGLMYRSSLTSREVQLFSCPALAPCICNTPAVVPTEKPKECPKPLAPKVITSSLSDSMLSKTHFSNAYSYPRDQVFSDIFSQGPRLGGPENFLLLTRKPGKGSATMLEAIDKCSELNVVFANDQSCMALVQNSGGTAPGFVYRYLPRKENDTITGWDFTTRVKYYGSKIPSDKVYDLQEEELVHLFTAKRDFRVRLDKLIQGLVHDNFVVVMAINLGNLDIFMNSLGSALANGVSTKNWLVFASDDAVRAAVELMGVRAFYDPGLGNYPSIASKGYGDTTFRQMMWLKTVSVFLVNDLGYDVLFQDADVVWFKDPYPFLSSPEYNTTDTLWMDDGARSERFSPFFGNTGYYFIRHNPRTKLLMRELIFSNHLVSVHSSHQTIVSQTVAEHVTSLGLTFVLLPVEEFPSGKVYHHNKELMGNIVTGDHVPFVFHMCWTRGRIEKLQYLKISGMWFLDDICTQAEVETHLGDKTWLNDCFTAAKPANASVFQV